MHDVVERLTIATARAESGPGYIRTSASLPCTEWRKEAQDEAIASSCTIIFGRWTRHVRQVPRPGFQSRGTHGLQMMRAARPYAR